MVDISSVKKFVLANGGTSVPAIQSKFKCGYAEAREIVTGLCENGIIAEGEGVDYVLIKKAEGFSRESDRETAPCEPPYERYLKLFTKVEDEEGEAEEICALDDDSDEDEQGDGYYDYEDIDSIFDGGDEDSEKDLTESQYFILSRIKRQFLFVCNVETVWIDDKILLLKTENRYPDGEKFEVKFHYSSNKLYLTDCGKTYKYLKAAFERVGAVKKLFSDTIKGSCAEFDGNELKIEMDGFEKMFAAVLELYAISQRLITVL